MGLGLIVTLVGVSVGVAVSLIVAAIAVTVMMDKIRARSKQMWANRYLMVVIRDFSVIHYIPPWILFVLEIDQTDHGYADTNPGQILKKPHE